MGGRRRHGRGGRPLRSGRQPGAGPRTGPPARALLHQRGQQCPGVAVAAAGDDVRLVRCEELGELTYTLVAPDTRTDGVWVLTGSARSDAARPALDVFHAMLDGAVGAYG